eukprot:gb/GEZN01013774.1/.p1 GENE.gb/GEZN01013774.1/~~gb/GEZN01013774.1/.p1  ORF type:complete len:285 (-),score=20.40 gb/GEZN01013774.1/:96-950(-)
MIAPALHTLWRSSLVLPARCIRPFHLQSSRLTSSKTTASACPVSDETASQTSPAATANAWGSMLPSFVTDYLQYRKLGTIHHNIGVRAAESAIEQAQHEHFYNNFGMPQKLRSHICLLAVHLWIVDMEFRQVTVHKRKHEGLFESFWKHVEILIYQNGEHAMLVKKRLKEVQQDTFGTLVSFNRCYELRQRGNRKPMLGAIYRNVYDCADNLDLRYLYLMDKYIHDCRQHLQANAKNTEVGLLNWPIPDTTLPFVSKKELASLDVKELSTPIISPGESVDTWRL